MVTMPSSLSEQQASWLLTRQPWFSRALRFALAHPLHVHLIQLLEVQVLLAFYGLRSERARGIVNHAQADLFIEALPVGVAVLGIV